MYCGLEGSILSMLNFLVLINVLRLYKIMFLDTKIFKGKKVSNLCSNYSENIFFIRTQRREKEGDKTNIRQM